MVGCEKGGLRNGSGRKGGSVGRGYLEGLAVRAERLARKMVCDGGRRVEVTVVARKGVDVRKKVGVS